MPFLGKKREIAAQRQQKTFFALTHDHVCGKINKMYYYMVD